MSSDDFDLGHSKRSPRLNLTNHPCSARSHQQNVMPIVLHFRMGNDLSQTDGRCDRRVLCRPGRHAAGQRCHGDQPISFEGLGQHLAVPRLEDVKRLHGVGKHHQLGQRKQTNPSVEIFRQSSHVFQVMHRSPIDLLSYDGLPSPSLSSSTDLEVHRTDRRGWLHPDDESN